MFFALKICKKKKKRKEKNGCVFCEPAFPRGVRLFSILEPVIIIYVYTANDGPSHDTVIELLMAWAFARHDHSQ